MNGVEQIERIAHLIGLQRADQVKLNSGKAGAERRPIRFGFLHPVLAEQAVACMEHRHDVLGWMTFGHRNQTRFWRR